jgi:hypothetical protein
VVCCFQPGGNEGASSVEVEREMDEEEVDELEESVQPSTVPKYK